MHKYIALLLALTSFAHAVDTTPPTLKITHTWMEKVGSVTHFKMYLDPQDETGLGQGSVLNTLWFRSALNTSTIPAKDPYQIWKVMPWKRGEPFDLAFACTSCVVELKVQDSSGNFSDVQRRYFASPFPYSPAPNLRPQLNPTVAGAAPTYSGAATDCRGLFSMQFDGLGTEDLVQVDRASGQVMVRRDIYGPNPVSDVSFTQPAGIMDDSAAADLDGDGRADLVIVRAGSVFLYHNDGPDVGGVVRFTPTTLNKAPTLITDVKNVALGDITGEGKPEIIISGLDNNGDARIGWFIKDAIWNYNAGNGCPAPAGSTPGKLAVGDLSRDGKLDVVMVDATNNQMIVFKNKGTGVLAGGDETDVNYQPIVILTGFGQAGPNPAIPSIAAPVRALAIGDVTGDGADDIITVMTSLVFSNPLDSNDGRTQQRWRLYENQGTSFRPFTDLLLGQSPACDYSVASESARLNLTAPPLVSGKTVSQGAPASLWTFLGGDPSSPTSWQRDDLEVPSDVALVEMGEDRFPEMVFTNYYNNSIKVIRFTPLLGNGNELTTLDDGTGNPELDEQDYVPPSSGAPLQGPSRLALGRNVITSAKPTIIPMTWATSDVARMMYFYTPRSPLTYSIQGGRSTDSDPDGSAGANGYFQYTAFVGEAVDHTLTAINNSDNALTGVFLDSTLAANESTPNGNSDAGWAPVTLPTWGKHVRYTVDIPPHTAVVKHYQTKILSGKVGSTLSGTCFIRQGTANTIVASSGMPIVTLKDPVQFRNTVESQSDNTGGDTAHPEEWIAYRMRITNQGDTDVFDNTLVFTMPSNTTHLDHSADSVLGVTPEVKVGSATYAFWKPNATITLNQKVLGSNNHIFQCTANGISGATAPSWNLASNGLTNDGPVVWKHIGTTEAAISTITWKLFDLAPNDDKTVEVRVKVKAGLAAGTKITRGAISFTRSDGTKQSAPSGYITTILNPLEITLNANKTHALPGETVRYTFNVTNHNFFNLGNCKVVDSVPPGMVFIESGASDGADSGVSGGTGNFNQFNGLYTKATLTPTSSPVALDIANILTWNLGTIPARTMRTIEFDLQVQGDVPNSYAKGTSGVTTSIPNSGYNFVGNNLAGTRLFAMKPTLGTKLATPQSAAGILLVAPSAAFSLTIDDGPPVNSPSIFLIKQFTGDDTVQIGGESYTLIINDAADTADGSCKAIHLCGNTGAGDARNVFIRDVIPANLNFAGNVQKNLVAFSNFSGWRFYSDSAATKELLPGESFTDTNGNGFYDVGEPYTDANGNKKFDGITASLVRSFDIFVGDLAGGSTDPLGSGLIFSYKMLATTTVQGTKVESTAGGMSGSKDGVNYTALGGYSIRAENLRFPVNGSPDVCRAIITAKAKVTFPMQTVKSRSDLKDNETATITVPYEVSGGTSVNLSDLKMDLDIPKGYSVVSAKIYNTAGAITRSYASGGSGNTITVTTNSAGVTHITFPLDGERISFPQFEIGINPATKSALLTNGVTTKPLTYKPVITGKWVKAAVPPPLAAAMARAGVSPPPDPAPVALATTETFGTLPTLADSTKDTRIFVTRVAPVSAKRGDSIQYVIVVGNLTLTPLSPATITFKVPKGLRGINVSQYAYHNGVGVGYVSDIKPATGRFEAVNHIRRWDTSNINTLLPSETPITVSTGALTDKEVGVVFLTCYVPPDFVGDYIDDNSVVFDVPNACAKSPGPSRIVMRTGTVEAERASITTSFLDGIQMRNTPEAVSALNSSFTLTEESCHFGMGGGDVLVMKNGLGMIALPGSKVGQTLVYDRVLVMGPPAAVSAPSGNFIFLRDDPLLLAGPRLAVAVGPGNTSTGIKLVDPPGYSLGVLKASDLLLDMKTPNFNAMASNNANMLLGGGNNLVKVGAADLSGAASGASVIMPDGTLHIVSAFTDAKLIGKNGASIVAAGGGNIVAAGGGNIVAAGGGNILNQDAATVVANDGAGVVANDGAGLVGQDGASIVAGGGMNIISVGTGNLIQANGITQGLGK